MLHDSHAPVALFVPESFFKERRKGSDFSLVCRLRLNIFFDFIRHVEVRSRRYLSSSKITARDLNGENQKDLLKHNQLFGLSVCEKRLPAQLWCYKFVFGKYCTMSPRFVYICHRGIYAGFGNIGFETQIPLAQTLCYLSEARTVYKIAICPWFHQQLHREWDSSCHRHLHQDLQAQIIQTNSVVYPKKKASHAFLCLCPFGTWSIRIQNTLNIHLLTVSHSS